MPVSTSTVKRRLRDAGLLGRVAKKKPYLRLANKRKILSWAKKHRHWTEEDWKKCYGQTNLSLRCVDHTEEHLWDAEQVKRCVCAGKVGDLYKVKGILNKEGYHSILQCHAIPCGQHLIGANLLLQQENDPKHTSKLCKNYLGKKQSAGILSVMEWPAQSPDLNPIQLLLEQLDCMVSKKCPSSHYHNKLAARMPKVCKAVIAANKEFFDESKVWRTKLLLKLF